MYDVAIIDPRSYDEKIMTSGQIRGWFEVCGAIWIHDGNPKNPHVELVSKICSNGFIDCGRVLCYPNIAEILALQLLKALEREGIKKPDWVIGSPYGSITFSYEVARAFKARHGFAEKDPNDPAAKKMIWRRHEIPVGANVLVAEELITTLWTAKELKRAVCEGNPDPVNFLPVVATLVYRPPTAISRDKAVIPLFVEKGIWAVEPQDCPLCKVGSPRFRPKGHWRELTGRP